MDDVPVRQIMSNPAFTIHANERLDKALFLFQNHGISILPVVNTNGCCVGVITLKDLVDKQNDLIAECRKRGCLIDDHSDQQQEQFDIPMSFFGDISVFDGMSADFQSVHEDATAGECIDALLDNHIHHLPILNSDERLVGVISTLDLIAYVRPQMRANEDDSVSTPS